MMRNSTVKNKISFNSALKICLIILLQLIVSFNLTAASRKKLPIKKPLFTQTIKWQPKQNSKGYYVVIQHQITTEKDKEKILKKMSQFSNYTELEPEETEENWENLITIETFDTKLELTLAAGKYRWKLKYRNALNRVANASKWRELNVNKAYKPEIDIFEPPEFYLDAKNQSILFIAGENISYEDTSISVYDKENKLVPQLMASKDELELLSNQYIDKTDLELDEDDYNWTGIKISPKKLRKGIYTVILENKGGLSTTQEFQIKYKYPIHIEGTAGWAPSFIDSSSPLAEILGTSFTKPAIFADGCCMITLTPYTRIGPQADFTVYNFKAFHEAYTVNFTGTILDFNLEAQLYSANRLFSFFVRAGGTLMTENYNIKRIYSSAAVSSWYTGYNAGLGFAIYFPAHIEFKTALSIKEIYRANETLTIFTPSIGVGLHF